MSLGEHPEWCEGVHTDDVHRSPLTILSGCREAVNAWANVTDRGTGPAVRVSAYGAGRPGDTLVLRDGGAVAELANLIETLAGFPAAKTRALAAQVRGYGAAAFGEAEAE